MGGAPSGAGTRDAGVDGGRFVARAAVGLVLAGVAVAALVLLLALVVSGSGPLAVADQAAVDALNGWVAGSPALVSVLSVVTELGGALTAVGVLTTLTVWLLVRRARHLALFVAVAGLGVGALTTAAKVVIARARPLLDLPLVEASGHSFPSGHTSTATVTYGALLLVLLPVVPLRWRRTAVAAAVAVIVLVGVTRVALGAHYPSDVVAGWIVGALWLGTAATAFVRSEPSPLRPRTVLLDGLAPQAAPALEPAPASRPTSRHRAAVAAARLVSAAVLIGGATAAVGFLVTSWAAIGRFDTSVVRAVAALRTPLLTDLMVAVGHAGGIRGIVLAVVVLAALAVALTRRWAPALLLVVAPVGETAIYVTVSTVVGRPRPAVEALTQGLPPTASFPSGHAAAAAVTYGAAAALVVAWTRSRWRWAAVVLAGALVLGVAASRVYKAVHYPTDVLAGLLLAGAWLAACWAVLRPGPRPRGRLPGVRTDDGVLLHVESDGVREAPVVVVLVHGLGGSSDLLEEVRTGLRPHVQDGGVRVVLPELRGHGGSGWRGHQVDVDRLADDLARVVEVVAAGGARVLLLGHSLGSVVVQALARRRPDLVPDPVGSVALVSTVAGPVVGSGRGRRLLLRVVWSLAPVLRVLHPLRWQRARQELRRHAFADGAPTEAVDRLEHHWRRTSPEVLAAFLPSLAGVHAGDQALRVLSTVPTVVITGDRDSTIPCDRSRDVAQRLGPRCRLRVVHGAGHMVPVTHPGAVVEEVVALLHTTRTEVSA